MRRFAFLALSAILSTAGCRHGPKAYLLEGLYGDEYFPRLGANELKDPTFAVVLQRLHSGGMETNIFADITVQNVGAAEAEFDPAQIELLVPETGITYFHLTKDKSTVSVPVGLNLISRTTLRPGQKTAGLLFFPTPQGKALVKTLEVSYRGQKLLLAPY